MPETPNTVKKQVYVSKENLQKVLEFLKTQNETLYLRKGAEAASAAKVKNALTLTVGDTDVVFNGSEAKSTAVAAKVHSHTASNISDFDGAVKKVVFGNQDTQGTVTAHKHDNLEALNMVTVQYVKDWNAKIGVKDVEKLEYSNTAMTGVKDVKTAIDVLVKNVQIGTAALADATANVNGLATRLTTAEGNISTAQTDIAALKTEVGDASSGLVKKVADLQKANEAGGAVANAIQAAKDAADAAQTAADNAKKAADDEAARAKGEEAKLQSSIDAVKDSVDAINDGTTGILAEAKKYADGKDTEIKNTIGTVAEGKTVVGLIADAQKQADKGVANAAAEATRATGVENALRADLGQKTDPAAANGSAFARIAQVKVDLTNEAITARNAEQAALKAGQDAQKDVDALEVKVGKADDTADKATVYGAIAAEKARAMAAEKKAQDQADANKAAIATLNGNDTVEGSVDKKIKDAIANVNTTTNGLAGRVSTLETKVGSANDAAAADGSLYARVAKNAADIGTIKADYLKSTDKTELANAIKTERDRIDAFYASAEVGDKAIDTLKEIQDYITSDGQAAATMTQDIADNKAAIAAINHETTGILAQAKADAAAKDETLHTAITGEIATAKQGAIESAAATAESKVNDAKTALQANIDKKADQTALQTEIDRAKAAETANKAVLDKLDGGVNVDGSVKKQIETARAALQANINAKVAQTDYNAKVKELEDADTALDSRLDALESGDNSVAAQVKVVADALDAHKKAQATKEKQVDDKLAVIQGEANVEGSIKKALADAKKHADDEDAKIEALLGTKEDAATADTAFGRIAKEAARAKAAEEALDSRIDTADSKIAALEATVDTKTTGLKDKMAAAEKDIDKLQADMTAAQGDINGINTDITNIQNTLLNLVPLGDDELQAMLDQVYTK